MRIGILTGGGDVPGLNAAIRAAVVRATDLGWSMVGIRRGWAGLTDVNLDDPDSREHYVLPLDLVNTRSIARTGGTFLHSSRTNPSKMKQVAPHLDAANFPATEVTKNGITSLSYDVSSQVLKNLEKIGIDALVAIGGDDTLSYAAKLNNMGPKVVAIPKTMDNDVRNTNYCIGFSTAISRALEGIERQRTVIGSHERIGIFRVFGRDAGHTSLHTAFGLGVRCCIPEYKVNLDKLIELVMKDKKDNPSNYSMVILSEGAEWEGFQVRHYGEADAYGHQKKESVGEALAQEVKARIKEETIVSDLTYELRGGAPDFIDRAVAITYGTMAVDALKSGRSGLMSATNDGLYAMAEIPDPKLGPRNVDVANEYDTSEYRPIYTGREGRFVL